MIIYLLISLLFIFQCYLLYLIKSKPEKSTTDIKVGKLSLRNIPKEIKYEDVESNFKTTYDVLETIRLEDWKVDITQSYDDYNLIFNSNCSNIEVMCRIRTSTLRENEIHFSYFRILDKKEKSQISVSYDSADFIKNDIITFMWEYILEYHDNKNLERKSYSENAIKSISSKLKTIRRSEKLDKILKIT